MISCIAEIEACVFPRNELDFETISDNSKNPNQPQSECRQIISSKIIAFHPAFLIGAGGGGGGGISH